MQSGRLDFGHVAGDAAFCAGGTGCAGSIGSTFFSGGRNVAGEAVGVIGGEVVHQRLVGIMAGNASNPGIALPPAVTVFKAVGSEANVLRSGAGEFAGDNVLPGAMARAAEISGIDAREIRRIENEAGAAPFSFCVSGSDVSCAGPMAGFTIHAWNGFGEIELIASNRSGGMTGEASARFAERQGAANGVAEAGRRGGGRAWRYVQGMPLREEADATFEKSAGLRKYECLAHMSGTKRP